MLEAEHKEFKGLAATAVGQPVGEFLRGFHILAVHFHDDVAAFDDIAPVFLVRYEQGFRHHFIDDESLEVLPEVQRVIQVGRQLLDLNAESCLDEKLRRHWLRCQFDFSVVCECENDLFV